MTNEVSPVSDWKAGAGTDLTVPSGLTCKARKPGGMDMFIRNGVVPNSLLPIVKKALADATDGSKKEVVLDSAALMSQVLDDPQMLADMMSMQDDVVIATVMIPTIHPAPRWTEEDVASGRCKKEAVGSVVPYADRDQSKVWIDTDIDPVDKQFIYQWAVGGTRDLERFREQQASTVATLSNGTQVPGASILPPG